MGEPQLVTHQSPCLDERLAAGGGVGEPQPSVRRHVIAWVPPESRERERRRQGEEIVGDLSEGGVGPLEQAVRLPGGGGRIPLADLALEEGLATP